MKYNLRYSKKQILRKRIFLSIVFALMTFVSNAQLGVGTSNPNGSAQLDIVADDKGILIPQVALINTTDTITITNGNVESLLVYNINTQNDVAPGFYYWSGNRWNRIVSNQDGTAHLTLTGSILDYINLDGTSSTINLANVVHINQTVTELIDNGDGTITYWDENSNSTTINIAAGAAGLSAYQIAVNNGFTGTETEWLTSLQGTSGIDGSDGVDGQDGIDGLSAYQIAVNNGFTGTETEWLTSLQGATGMDGSDGVDGQDGIDGLSAYQTALNNGFVGTETEWLASLQGTSGIDGSDGVDGQDGLSAYQIALNNGFVGTETEWLASLQGSGANVTLIDGTNTTVQSSTSEDTTQWQVNVATANGTNLGVVKEAATNPTVKIDSQGALSVNMESLNDIKEISGTYQVQLSDNILLGDASTADVTVILPSPADNKGKTFTIKKQDANEDYYVNVHGNISGLPSNQLYTALPYSGWVLVSDGTQWRITNKF